MNKTLQWTVVSMVSIAVLAGAAYGGWLAWETGRIGDNPRAIAPGAMAEAVRRQAHFTNLRRGGMQACLPIDLNNPRADQTGLPGIAPRSYPGQQAWTLLLQASTREQPGREKQLAQLNYLAAQGLLKAESTLLETDAGALPAMRYTLTWEGYKNLGQEGGGNPLCLVYGRRTLGEITQIDKVDERLGDFDVYEATLPSRVDNLSPWAAPPEAKRLFSALVMALEPRTEKVRVIRTREGWRSTMELQTELNLSTAGNERDSPIMRQQMAALFQEPPAVQLQEARSLVAQHLNDPQWTRRHGTACLPLRLQRGGDDLAARNAREPEGYSVLVQDREDRKEHEYRALSQQLHLLAALKAVGFAQMEVVRPGGSTRARSAAALPPTAAAPLPDLPGLRFTLHPAAISAFGLVGGSGCLPVGRLDVEVLTVRAETGGARIAARGTVTQPQEWALNLAAHLPTLKALLEQGVPLRGMLAVMTPNEQPPKWRLADLSPLYPEPTYQGLPADLAPLLPRTAAAMPKATLVRAPALLQQQDANTQAALNAAAAAAVPRPAPAPATAPRN